MDVISLYPSVDIDFVVENSREIICDTEVNLQEVNTRDVDRFKLSHGSNYLYKQYLRSHFPTRSKRISPPAINLVVKVSTTERRSGYTPLL